jgi:hypothetical protein
MTRAERRAQDPNILAKKLQYQVSLGGGMGLNNPGAKPAQGSNPVVNPFMMPKPQGLNVISQTYLSNFFSVEWDRSAWRLACDQAIRMGWPINYAILVQWVYQSSAFVRSLYKQQEDYIASMEIRIEDLKGNVIEDMTQEICDKTWFKELKKKICTAPMEGFRGLNFDPIGNKTFEYSMQDIDPINRFLRKSTFDFADGVFFDQNVNILFVQPSSSEKEFLGYMQTISRDFIEMNLNDTNWVQAGKRLAFPIIMMGYPMSGATNDPNDPTGQSLNNYWKSQAENAIATLDPSNGFVFPFTRKPDGTVEKSFEFELGNTQTRGNAHAIYKDFDDFKKNDTREWLFGSILTSSVGKSGSYKLGDIHKDKYLIAMKSLVDYTLGELNGDFLQKKLPYFYKGFPISKCKFGINKARQFEVDEIVALTTPLTASGFGWTPAFFEAQGIAPEHIEPIAQATPPPKENPQNLLSTSLKLATEEKGFFSTLKKKVVS